MVFIERSTGGKFSAGEALEARRLRSNLPFILGSLVMLLLIGFLNYLGNDTNNAAESAKPGALDLIYDRDIKPYIYQFDVVSQEVDDLNRQIHGGGTRKIPYIWNQVWTSAGWTPVQLQVGKYEAEPAYQPVVALLESVPEIQRRHVYKYLAMAAVGGGYVAHTDTFPLHPFGSTLQMPNEGRITLYSASYPCLMSGNATEWLRMAHRIAEHAQLYTKHHPDKEWTEALAMHEMQLDYNLQDGEIFDVPNVAAALDDGASAVQWAWNSGDCQATQHKRGVHFRIGAGEDLARMKDPGDMIIKWLSMWLQSCERSNYFIDLEQLVPKTVEPAEPVLAQTGSYHAPENYNETRAQEAAAAVDTIMDEENADEVKPEQPPVQIGTYHAPENYTASAVTTIVVDEEPAPPSDAPESNSDGNQRRDQQQFDAEPVAPLVVQAGSYHAPENIKEMQANEVVAGSTTAKAPLVVPTGTYHAPANYIDSTIAINEHPDQRRDQDVVVVQMETRHAPENYHKGAVDNEAPERPPVAVGTYHVPGDYDAATVVVEEGIQRRDQQRTSSRLRGMVLSVHA